MSGHTPGPWLIRDGDQVITGGGIWHAHEWPASQETLANARLIAASPKMLAACKAAVLQMDAHECDCDDYQEVIGLLESVIAEAASDAE